MCYYCTIIIIVLCWFLFLFIGTIAGLLPSLGSLQGVSWYHKSSSHEEGFQVSRTQGSSGPVFEVQIVFSKRDLYSTWWVKTKDNRNSLKFPKNLLDNPDLQPKGGIDMLDIFACYILYTE